MKLEKKHYIAGVIGLVTITGALAYLQYKRMMDYIIKIKNLRVNKFTLNNADLDMTLDYQNKSNINIAIDKTIVNVYLNGKFVTKIESNKDFLIKGNSSSLIPINIKFNPSDIFKILKVNVTDLALNQDKIIIEFDTILKAKLWFFNIGIKEKYKYTLKELITT